MLLAAFAAAALPAPPPGGVTAEQAIARAQEVYGIASVARGCRPASGDEIVVCADRGKDQRVPEDTTNTDTGIPRAPAFAPRTAGGVTVTGCFLQKCPKELYFIDVKALPEAPPGSDADKIAKGEAPAR